MTHILSRHHPKYFSDPKGVQSFFRRNTTIDEIVDLIREVLKQNPEKIKKIGVDGYGPITGTVNGVKYQLGLSRSHIGQFFPVGSCKR